ncbi:MAG: hypothetical protein LBR51_01020 [Bacteroidales bacterium]|jgi:vacuolar-type H+-ATPase subunit H|nr:hypothetical protein [Bacteroidales bacterium]
MATKGLKIAGGCVLGLLVLLIIVPMFFQKPLITMALKQANRVLNAEISVGDFRLTLFSRFPHPTLKIKQVLVLNKEPFVGDTLAAIGEFDACIDLFSVFSGKYHVKKINLENTFIYLYTNEDSLSNWDIARPDTLQEEQDTEASSLDNLNLKIDRLTLSNINICYTDIPGDICATVTGLDFDFSGDLSRELTAIKMDLTAKAVDFKMNKIPYLKKTAIGMKTKAKADLKNMKFTISDNEIKINALLLQLEGWVALPDSLSTEMDMQLKLKQSSFKELLSLVPAIYAKNFSDIQTSGAVALSAFAKGTLAGEHYPAFGLDLKVSDAMFKYPALPAAVNHIQIHATVNNPGGSLDYTILDLKEFHLEMIDNPIDLAARVSTPISDPDIRARVNGTIHLDDIQKVYPLENKTQLNGTFKMNLAAEGRLSYLEKQQYDRFKANGDLLIANLVFKNTTLLNRDMSIPEARLVFSPAFADLQKFVLQFGRDDLSINGKIENYLPFIFKDHAVLSGNVNITSNYLNVNDFMSQPGIVSSSDNQEQTSPEPTEPLTLIQVPDNLNVKATVAVKKLIYDNIDMDNASLSCSVANKRLTISNLSAALFKGNIRMSGSYETPRTDLGTAQLNVSVNSLSPKELCKTFEMFNQFMPILNAAEGRVSLTLAGNTSLNKQMQPDYSTMNANGMLAFSDLHVKNTTALTLLADAFKMEAFKNLSLKDVKLSYTIKDGKMHTKPFNFKVDQSNVSVEEGSIGLDKTLDYVATTEIPRAVMGAEALKVVDGLVSKAQSLGLPAKTNETAKIAVKISGTLDNPKFDLGLDQMKDQMKETVQAVVEQAKEQIKETVNTALDEAKQKADALVAEARKQADALLAAGQTAADKIMETARAEANKMVESAKNPVEKAAKKVAADKVLQEAQKKADKAQADAKQQANKLVSDAQIKGDKLIEDAKKK